MSEHFLFLQAVKRAAFVQGFVTAKDPKTPHETLLACAEADVAYDAWQKTVTDAWEKVVG